MQLANCQNPEWPTRSRKIITNETGLTLTYVPEYSPNTIAGHAVSLMLALSRHLIQAH